MFRNFTLKCLTFAFILALTSTAATSATAGDYCHYQPSYPQYKTVIVQVPKTIEIVNWVTRYDAYGCAYKAKVISLKTIYVPVEKVVRVDY